MRDKIGFALRKLTTALDEEESSKEIMNTRNAKFRKFLFRVGNHPYYNAVLTPAEVISLQDATDGCKPTVVVRHLSRNLSPSLIDLYFL